MIKLGLLTLGSALILRAAPANQTQFNYGPDVEARALKLAKGLPREEALAKKEGLWLVPSDLRRAWPKPSDRENAGPRLVRAAKELSTWRRSHPFDAAGEGIEAPAMSAILDRVRTASKLPFCDFGWTWAGGAAMVISEPVALSGLTSALRNRALYRFTKGKYPLAVADLETTIRLGRLLSQSPGTIAMLTSSRLQSKVLSAIDKLAKNPSTPQKVLRSLVGLVKMIPAVREDWGIKGDALIDQVTIGHIDTIEKEMPPDGSKVATTLKKAPVRAWVRSLNLRYWRRMLEASNRPGLSLDDRRKAIAEVDASEHRLFPSMPVQDLLGGNLDCDVFLEAGNFEVKRRATLRLLSDRQIAAGDRIPVRSSMSHQISRR